MNPLTYVTAEHRRVVLRCLEGVVVWTPGRGVDALARPAWEAASLPGRVLSGSWVLLTQAEVAQSCAEEV